MFECVLINRCLKQVKCIAKRDNATPAAEIFEGVLMKTKEATIGPSHSRQNPVNVIRTVNRVRASMRPEEPKDLTFEVFYICCIYDVNSSVLYIYIYIDIQGYE